MDIFRICAFETKSTGAEEALRVVLAAGLPVNLTLGELDESPPSDSILSSLDQGSGFLHVICSCVKPSDVGMAISFVDILFDFGANWMLLDGKSRTPGCICLERELPQELYNKFVRAGVRSEIFLSRMLEEDDDDNEKNNGGNQVGHGPEDNQSSFLNDPLKYSQNLLTTSASDGVMMEWERPIMRKSAEKITTPGGTVLNIGFGLGIIDTYIQERAPGKHFIVEAHPAVLQKMRETGWYDNPTVVVLEGTWRQVLPKILEQGITFDGIYYDTFSEHYSDMKDLFDYICGLLSFEGVFSYFNGLGADRQICHDIYKEVVRFDLHDFGLEVKYETFPLDISPSEFEGLKRSYYKIKEYSLPLVTFMTDEVDSE